MAEGFARAYGSDVIEPVSAGLAPASIIQPLTRQVMEEKNIGIDELYPKDLGRIDLENIDILINISGRPLPANIPIEVREWRVDDPIGKEEADYVTARDQIERLVMGLILDLRRPDRPPSRQPSLRTRLNRGNTLSH